MTKSPAQKLALAPPQSIPLDKLDIHEDNVRKSAEDQAAIEDLAADIAARGLLQSLSVRPILDADGRKPAATAFRRAAAASAPSSFSSSRRSLRRTRPSPASSRRTASPRPTAWRKTRSDKRSNPGRIPRLQGDGGQGTWRGHDRRRVPRFDIVVRQRMRLANASPLILKAYEDDEVSLEQLMAYCVTTIMCGRSGFSPRSHGLEQEPRSDPAPAHRKICLHRRQARALHRHRCLSRGRRRNRA